MFDDADDNSDENDLEGGEAVIALAAVLGVGIAIGVGLSKALPAVKGWTTETAIPKMKNTWKKLLGTSKGQTQKVSIELAEV